MRKFQTEYKTRDLSEASILFALQKNLLRIEREGKICFFVFEDRNSCQKIADQFWFGKCLVDGKTYYQAMLTLKNRIFLG